MSPSPRATSNDPPSGKVQAPAVSSQQSERAAVEIDGDHSCLAGDDLVGDRVTDQPDGRGPLGTPVHLNRPRSRSEPRNCSARPRRIRFRRPGDARRCDRPRCSSRARIRTRRPSERAIRPGTVEHVPWLRSLVAQGALLRGISSRMSPSPRATSRVPPSGKVQAPALSSHSRSARRSRSTVITRSSPVTTSSAIA